MASSHAYRWGTTYTLAFQAKSGVSVNTNATPFGPTTYAIRVNTSINCYIAVGINPTAGPSSGTLVSAGSPFDVIRVSPGESIAAISQSTSAGFINIVELTQ